MAWSEVYEGLVTESTYTPLKDGTFNVLVDGEGVIPVIYCSPYGGNNYGLAGIPEPHTRVAVAKTQSGNWIYIGTMFVSDASYKTTKQTPDGECLPVTTTMPDHAEMYKYTDTPGKFIIKDPGTTPGGANRFYMNHQLAEGKDDRGIMLETEMFKIIHMSDVKDSEWIFISDYDDPGGEGPNYIEINKDNKTIDVICTRDMKLRTRRGNIFMEVEAEDVDTNINITNYSQGDINIVAQQGNINVLTMKEDININAKKDINMIAGRNMNVTVENNISIEGKTSYSLLSPNVKITAKNIFTIVSEQVCRWTVGTCTMLANAININRQ